MALNHSPSIVTSGLVFAYDMNNTQKSWRGAPTTNKIIADPIGISTYAYVSGPVATSNISDAGSNLRTVNRYTVTSTAGIRRAAIHPTGLTTGVMYSFSYVYRNNGTGTDIYVDASKGNPEGGTNNNTFATNTVTTENLGNGWIYVKYTFSYSACPTGACILAYGNGSAAIGETFDVYNEQFEINSFCTPFVNGTRSNTQALIDLTGNNTITASSLTYASDGTFSFNGSSNYITIPNTTLGNGNVPWTVSAWVKTNTTVNALGQGSVLSNSSGGPVCSMMGVNAGKIVYWTYQNAAWVQKLGTGKTVNDNTWHLLTWVNYNNYTMDMYVDGVLDSNVPNSTSGNNNPVDRIGGSWAAQFNGSISSLSRYNRALSAAEVKQNFNALRGRYGI